MKKLSAAFFAFASICAVIVAILAGAAGRRNEEIRQQPPMALEELDELLQSLQQNARPGTPAHGPANEASDAHQLPRRINRPLTEQQRRKLFMQGDERSIIAFLGSGPLGAVADAAAIASGRPAGFSWARAGCNLVRGNWRAARLYYAEFIRVSDKDEYKQRAFAYLAWLEDDPQLAARYAEAACSGEDWRGMLLTVELAVVTGSTELADYALERGRTVTSNFDAELSRSAVFEATRQWLLERQEKGREPER